MGNTVVNFIAPNTRTLVSRLTSYNGEDSCQIHSVNDSYLMGRLTCYNEEDVVRSGVNHSYTMSRLTIYKEEDVVRSTVSIARIR
jgi:hypothetical protein